jgi:hypothetical protein
MMSELRCYAAGCGRKPTTTARVSRAGVPEGIPVCSEHAHDIDWGVYVPQSMGILRKREEPAPETPPFAA